MTAFAAHQRPRLRPCVAAACLVGLLVAPGCDDDSNPEAAADKPVATVQSGELASLSFESVAYVEASANNLVVLDRVRHELKSAFSALQVRQITISQRRQVDVDLKRLSREPITVIDPVTRAARPAVRLRYRFVGLAVVPKAMAEHGDALLGLLHRDDLARAAEVVETCTSPASRRGDAVKQPWRIFDPGLEACARAIDAEQAKIDEARAGLEHPDREIVTAELERLYMPTVLHVKIRGASVAANPESSAPAVAPAGGPPPAGIGGPASGPPSGIGGPGVGADRTGPGVDRPSSGGTAPLGPAGVAAAQREERLLAKLKGAEKPSEADDEREVAEIISRRSGGGLRGTDDGPKVPFLGYGGETQPVNYGLLWFASIAVIAILGTEIRRRLLRGGSRGPRR